MSALARALLADLDAEALRELAERLAPHMPRAEAFEDDHVKGCLTVAEVCARLNVSPKVVRGLIERGELAASKVGKEYRIDPRALHAYEQASRVSPRASARDIEPKTATRRGARRGRLRSLLDEEAS